MNVGLMLPYNVAGLDRDTLVAWCRRIDDGPYSSLGCGDRVAFHNLDLLVTLSAAAVLTTRVRLVSDILIAVSQPAPLLAKRAASIDVLSNGRLSLGLGIGNRPDDYAAANSHMERRHARLDDTVAEMRRLWSGAPLTEGGRPVGPMPVQSGGPPLFAGAFGPKATARACAWADGFLPTQMAFPTREALGGAVTRWRDAWAAAGRSGAPYFLHTAWFALGDDALATLQGFVREYLGIPGLPPAFSEHPAASAEAVRRLIDDCEAVGVDELMLMPVSADLRQLDELDTVLAP